MACNNLLSDLLEEEFIEALKTTLILDILVAVLKTSCSGVYYLWVSQTHWLRLSSMRPNDLFSDRNST